MRNGSQTLPGPGDENFSILGEAGLDNCLWRSAKPRPIESHNNNALVRDLFSAAKYKPAKSIENKYICLGVVGKYNHCIFLLMMQGGYGLSASVVYINEGPSEYLQFDSLCVAWEELMGPYWVNRRVAYR